MTLHKGSPPAYHTAQYVSQLTNELTTGGGYIQGADATNKLPSQSLATDGAGNITFSGGTMTWNGGGGGTTFPSGSAPTYAILSDRSPPNPANQPLLALIDFGAEQTTAGGNFVVTWSASGILKLTFPP